MKKVYMGLAMALLMGIQALGQCLQPSFTGMKTPLENPKSDRLEILIQNHYLQKNINDLYSGYCHSMSKMAIWTIGRWSNQSLIQIKSLGVGCQLQLGTLTHLAHELSFAKEQFPEGVQQTQWQSRLSATYLNQKFQVQYQHFWIWNHSLLQSQNQPLQSLTLQLSSSQKHQLQFALWQFVIVPAQIRIQHQIALQEKWSITWGFQWPQTKYWFVLKNKNKKIQSSFCLLVQPYFLPSFYQYHEMDLR
jgi:hypothetical protein